jgi:hypothetical protein
VVVDAHGGVRPLVTVPVHPPDELVSIRRDVDDPGGRTLQPVDEEERLAELPELVHREGAFEAIDRSPPWEVHDARVVHEHVDVVHEHVDLGAAVARS